MIIPDVGRKDPRVRFALFAIAAFLWVGVALHLVPFWWMISTSLKPTREIFEFPPTLWPREPTVQSYNLLFSTLSDSSGSGLASVFRYPIWVYLKNSVILTALVLAIQVPVTTFAAYAVSRLHAPKSARWVFLVLIGTLMVPAEIALIPRFLLLSHFPWPTSDNPTLLGFPLPALSLVGSFWGVVLPAAYSAFNFLMLKGTFDTVPQDLLDAARIDGAGELRTFWHVALPLAKPVLAVVIYFTFSGAWNNFMGPWIILMGEQDKWPLAVVMNKLQQYLLSWQPSQGAADPAMLQLVSGGVGYNLLMAISLVESVPVFIMFLVFREQVMKGVRLQGFK